MTHLYLLLPKKLIVKLRYDYKLYQKAKRQMYEKAEPFYIFINAFVEERLRRPILRVR